jgi:hypothetical protein
MQPQASDRCLFKQRKYVFGGLGSFGKGALASFEKPGTPTPSKIKLASRKKKNGCLLKNVTVFSKPSPGFMNATGPSVTVTVALIHVRTVDI